MSGMKKFNKKEGFRFTLLHRSQQDPLYHDEENGSKYILHPADRKTAKALESGMLQQEGSANYVSSESAAKNKQELLKKRQKELGPLKEYREVDEFGFPLDGYDYNKHLSAIGGGAFISADGSVVPSAVPVVENVSVEEDVLQMLPDSVFASLKEQPRLLEAITLKPDHMDEDMKKQLGLLSDLEEDEANEEESADDNDSAATGEWGDLQDDFISQVISGGVISSEGTNQTGKPLTSAMDEAFDFDAHVARMLREAEEADAAVDNDDEDEDDVDEFMASSARKGGAGSGVDRPSREVDDHFNAVFADEYDNDYDDDDVYGEEDEQDAEDDELGENEEEVEDEDFELEVDDINADDILAQIKKAEFESESRKRSDMESRTTASRRSKKPPQKLLSQDDPVFLQAVNEFLKQKESDASLGDVAQPPSAQEILGLRTSSAGLPNEEESATISSLDGAVKSVEAEEDEEDEEEEEEPTYEEFLKLWGTYTVAERPQFDCQTIVSTRSTVDNIPSQIVIENKKAKAKKQPAATNIRKSSLREDMEDDNDSEKETVESLARDVARMTLARMNARSSKETPQERKARKNMVKEMKRERRVEKKSTKEAFQKERVHVLHALTAEGAPKPGVSEFKIA